MDYDELLAALDAMLAEAQGEHRAGDAEALAMFKAKLAHGGSCAELFDIRGQVHPKSDERAVMNDLARSVGCYHRDATRQDAATVHSKSYRTAYDIVAADPEQVFGQAGTRNVEEAADWYASGFTAGTVRDSARAGCLDALRGAGKDRGQSPTGTDSERAD